MNNVSRFTLFLFSFVLIAGLLVIVGWHFNILTLKTIVPGFISMKVNTALGFIGLALASIFLTKSRGRIFQSSVGIFISVTVFTLGFLSIVQYLFNVDFKIDEALYKDLDGIGKWAPGRLAPITAVNFLFISTSLILHTLNAKYFVKFTQALVIIAWISAFQALIGYICGNSYTFGSAFYTQIAIHTAVLFVALTSGILLNWRNEGYFKHLTHNDVAGRVGRKLLLAAVVVPPLINVLQLHGQKMQLIDEDFGVLLRVVGMIVCFAWMAMVTGKYLFEIDEKRAAAELAQKIRTEELQRALMARDDLLSICSHELRTPISSMKLQTQFVKYQMEKEEDFNLS